MIIKNLRHKLIKPIYTNPLYLYFSNFSDSFLLFLLLPFVARVFGPEIIGEIGLAQSIGLLYLILFEFGFSISATKEVAKNESVIKTKFLASQITSFKLYFMPLILLITSLIIIFNPIFNDKPILIIISTFDAIFQGFIPSWYFKGRQNFRILALTRIVFRFFFIILIFIFVKETHHGWLYLLMLCFSSLSIAITQNIFLIKEIGYLKLCSFQDTKKIISTSYHTFLIVLLPTIYNNIGIIFLSYMANPLYLGYYYGVSKIHRAFNTLYTPVFETFFPRLVKTYNSNKFKAYKQIKIYSIIIFLLGVSFLAVILFFSENIIYLVLGSEFIESRKYLISFGFLLPLTVISYIWGNQWMVVLGKEKDLSKILIISNLVGIIILAILMPKYLIFSIPISICVSEILKIILIIKNLQYDKT